jgi:CubicO group peptidase (beta-lactamase class C family)
MNLEDTAERAFRPVAAAIAAGRIPGAALGLVTADGHRAVRWAGRAAVVPEEAPLDRATWFDLASLTKVMLTTVEILRLVERGEADLDDPLQRHLPDLARHDSQSPVRALSLRRLLSHHTFLPANEPIHTWGGDPAALRAMVLAHDWPQGRPAYSDINFILLGLVIERRHGVPLNALPLPEGLDFAPDPAQTAATEHCSWRGRMLRAEVSDEKAFALGGVGGHAGLFGTVDAVLDFARDLMAGRVLGPAAMAAMTRPQTPTRALGWQRWHVAEDNNGDATWVGGSLCSPETLGHTGFTGVGLWIDPPRRLAWTLLTNRVHPSRFTETGIQDLRRSVGNIVAAGWRG